MRVRGQKAEDTRERQSECGFSAIEEFFGTEEEQRIKDSYAEGVSRGGVLVLVFAEDEDIARVEKIMNARGAPGIENRVKLMSQPRPEKGFPWGSEADTGVALLDENRGGGAAAARSIRIYNHSS